MSASERSSKPAKPTGPVSPARLVAVTVLYRVAEQEAYASLALDAEIGRSGLDHRDASLATEIVYGSLRVMPALDRAIAHCVDRPRATLDALTRAVLRASCYQLYYLDRAPDRAVVHDAVTMVEQRRSRALAGFANAVLRKLAASRPAGPTPPAALVMPQWLTEALQSALGAERFDALARSRPLPPPLCLRANTERVGRDELIKAIRSQIPSASVEPGALSPLAVLVRGGGDPRKLPGYRRGWFAVQEEGAQLVVLATGAREGEKVADACAGHGNKTALLASLTGSAGRVTAIDIDENKLDQIHPELERLGLDGERVVTAPVDLTTGIADLGPIFDLVLVDAPCTGLGTVNRRPDLLLRAGPGDADRLGAIQHAILSRAASLVRPGGRLFYAVCSPLHQEGSRVAERFEAEKSTFHRIEPEALGTFPPADQDGILRIGPWQAAGTVSSPDLYQVIGWSGS